MKHFLYTSHTDGQTITCYTNETTLPYKSNQWNNPPYHHKTGENITWYINRTSLLRLSNQWINTLYNKNVKDNCCECFAWLSAKLISSVRFSSTTCDLLSLLFDHRQKQCLYKVTYISHEWLNGKYCHFVAKFTRTHVLHKLQPQVL